MAHDCEYETETVQVLAARRGTDKLLARLAEHHDFTIPKPVIEKKPAKVKNDPELAAFAGKRLKDIQRAVAEYYNITILDLVSNRKPMQIVHARQVAYYLCRTLTTWSLPSIGRMFGGRDHTTVMYGVQKIGHLLPRRTDLAYDIAHLTLALGGEPE